MATKTTLKKDPQPGLSLDLSISAGPTRVVSTKQASTNLKKRKQLLAEATKRAKRKAYEADFTVFAREQIKIRTKILSEGFVPFELNEAQQIIHDAIEEQKARTGRVRVIILKARQQGISTYFAARIFAESYFKAYHSSVILAHDTKTSDALFDMSKGVIDKMDKQFRPELEKSNAKEIIFAHNKSNYRLFTAGSPDAGRGLTPTIAHCTEVAFWPYDKKILAGLFQGIADAPGTEIILESTANGVGNEFHRMWLEAEAGNSDYIAIFIPWFKTKEYRRTAPPGFTRTKEEQQLVDTFGLDDHQLYWRRLKIIESGEQVFKQEYPSTAKEAFLLSGAPVFNLEKINALIPQPIKLSQEFDFELSRFADVPSGHRPGSLQIWLPPTAEEAFVIGADTSLGVGKDYQCATVLDVKKRIRAIYRNNEVDPSRFGDILFYLSRMFNNALLGVEANSMGLATLNRLQAMKHMNLYVQTRLANLDPTKPGGQNPGFKTTASTKPAIIGFLQRAIEDDELWIPSPATISELSTYITDASGGTCAAPGAHDDCVMSLAIALEMLRTDGHRLTINRVPYQQRQQYQQQEESTWF